MCLFYVSITTKLANKLVVAIICIFLEKKSVNLFFFPRVLIALLLFLLNLKANKLDFLQYLGLSDAFCKHTGHFDLSTVPDLSCVLIRKRHRENRETISLVKKQLIICPYFG